MKSALHLSPELTRRRGRFGVVQVSVFVVVMLTVLSWTAILLGDSGLPELFRPQTWRDAGEFVGRLLGLDVPGTPVFLDSDSWSQALRLSVDTLAMSVLAAAIAGFLALVTFLPGARNVAFGELRSRHPLVGIAAFGLLRVNFAFARAVPELVWAMLIVFVVTPGILAGALALAVHNYGILAKLMAEVVENIDPRPSRALRAAGANGPQMLLYGILPQVLPQFLMYLLYRWEVIIRTTVVVGLVAAGGLGLEFRLNMSFRHFDDVGLLLLIYMVLVLGVDIASAGLRRLAR